MKKIIKKLLRESLSTIAGFDNVTPEEKTEIDKRFHDYMLSRVQNAVKHKKELNQYYNTLEHIKTSELDQYIKDTLIKDFSDKIRTLETSIESTKNINKEEMYNFISKNYLSYKRYEDERIKARENKVFGKEDIINLFVDALEGGSNYWYHIRNIPKDVRRDIPLSEAIGEYILNGGYIEFYDAEGEEYDDDSMDIYSDKDLLGTVDINSLLDAINKIKHDYPDVWENILDEQYDANDADIFLQLCVMGEVEFG